MFAIWPSLQGQGFGKKTLEAMHQFLTSLNLENIPTHYECMVASENTHLFSFYEKQGFSRTGITKDWPPIWGELLVTNIVTLIQFTRPFSSFYLN